MKANPGGQIPLDEIIGRDEFIKNLWSILEQLSLVLCAERRIGKTSIIKKMESEALQKGLVPVFRDLENIATPMEFVETVYRDVRDFLSKTNRIAKGFTQLLSRIGGTEIAGIIKLPEFAMSHWKKLLSTTIEDLVENQEQKMIFFWDELPWMLQKIKQNSDEKTAMEILDVLRSLRQMHPELRMVYTGSIGIHNVITSLKRAGYTNTPLNDMFPIDVPPLSPEYAHKLAKLLIEGEGIKTKDITEASQAIAEYVDGIPFYIHHVVKQMSLRKHPDIKEDQGTVSEIVKSILTDPFDRLDMRHFLERLDIYYTTDERPFALSFLDILAMSDQPLIFGELFNRLKSQMETDNKEMALSMLTLLQRDHYIIQNTDGTYQFRFPLIKRWWRLQRGDDQ